MSPAFHETERADLIAALDGAQKALAMFLAAKHPSEIIHVWAACIAAEAVARRVLAQVADADGALRESVGRDHFGDVNKMVPDHVPGAGKMEAPR